MSSNGKKSMDSYNSGGLALSSQKRLQTYSGTFEICFENLINSTCQDSWIQDILKNMDTCSECFAKNSGIHTENLEGLIFR